ncbi:MAG: response regulator [Proteobacteria bacterium]|nr:response regulator [Pseudomonadota bacterium]MBU1649630.1 response regulator [Pseudomonadota bacterium]
MNQQPVILCVDDEAHNLSLLEALLVPRGYKTLLANDGKSALIMLRSEQVDLVLLDVMMPGMDGFEVCRRIKADRATCHIPVLFITSLDDSAVEIRGLDLGAADYLVKPFVPAVLQARVQTHLALKAHRDRMEELAEERAKQLVHADRLSTLGTLAAGIAHEINTPLFYIICFAQVLLSDIQKLTSQMTSTETSEATLRDAWQLFIEKDADVPVKIAEGANRIRVIMESMRKFSCQGQVGKAPVSLDDCIENALTLCHNELKYHVTVHKEVAADLEPVMANGQQMEQVFVNLFKNAADAMDKKKKGTLTITLCRENDFIRCTVEDNGPGIHPQQLDMIWEPFFSTKDAETGTGLGLSVSRGIIKDHQGRIWAENREQGEGARFVVELPVKNNQQNDFVE